MGQSRRKRNGKTVNFILKFLAALTGKGDSNKKAADEAQIQNAEDVAKNIVNQAEEEKRKLLLSAQEEALKQRTVAEQEIKEQRQELNRSERRHDQREEQLEQKIEAQEEQQRTLAEKETQVQVAIEDAEELKANQRQALEKIASLSVVEARQQVVKQGEEEAQHELQKRFYDLEAEHKLKADESARRIITTAINRLATDVVSEVTTSVVTLPNDEMNRGCHAAGTPSGRRACRRCRKRGASRRAPRASAAPRRRQRPARERSPRADAGAGPPVRSQRASPPLSQL